MPFLVLVRLPNGKVYQGMLILVVVVLLLSQSLNGLEGILQEAVEFRRLTVDLMALVSSNIEVLLE